MPTSALERFDAELKIRRGLEHLIGVDEAGRGPLAGPVVAAAVLLPPSPCPELEGARDSKCLSPRRRENLFEAIRVRAERIGVGWATAVEIDRRNIHDAARLAMRRALSHMDLGLPRLLVVVDGPWPIPGVLAAQEPVVDGDALSSCVACASIVAKVVRDRWMLRLDRRYPGYGFSRNKGYGTAEHLRALDLLGPSRAHRMSFAPVRGAAVP